MWSWTCRDGPAHLDYDPGDVGGTQHDTKSLSTLDEPLADAKSTTMR
jgi:hypothetical protein